MNDILNREDYLKLQEADLTVGVAEVLRKNGKCRWTVCPECRVDDFTHVEGCSMISKTLDRAYG